MDRSKIINALRHYKREHATDYGILEIGVFGSVARGDVGGDADVDVVLRISKPDLFILAGIKDELEERLGKPVDLVAYRESMSRFLKGRIDREAVYA
jgi:predicted nucleotidyltransferase